MDLLSGETVQVSAGADAHGLTLGLDGMGGRAIRFG